MNLINQLKIQSIQHRFLNLKLYNSIFIKRLAVLAILFLLWNCATEETQTVATFTELTMQCRMSLIRTAPLIVIFGTTI